MNRHIIKIFGHRKSICRFMELEFYAKLEIKFNHQDIAEVFTKLCDLRLFVLAS